MVAKTLTEKPTWWIRYHDAMITRDISGYHEDVMTAMACHGTYCMAVEVLIIFGIKGKLTSQKMRDLDKLTDES